MLFGSRKEKKSVDASEAKNGAAPPPRPSGVAMPVVEPAAPRGSKAEMRNGTVQAETAPLAKGLTLPAALPAEEAQRRADYSHRVMQAFGAIVAVYMRSKAHRDLRLAEIESIVGPAVTTGQFSLAEATHKQNGLVTPVAVVLWASVSDAMDEKLAAHPQQPLRLSAAEWKSGERVWVIEAIGEQRMLGAMLKQLRDTTWKGRTVKMRSKENDGSSAVRVLGAKADTGASRAGASAH